MREPPPADRESRRGGGGGSEGKRPAQETSAATPTPGRTQARPCAPRSLCTTETRAQVRVAVTKAALLVARRDPNSEQKDKRDVPQSE